MEIVLSILEWFPAIIFVLMLFVRYVLPYIFRGLIKVAEKKGNICDVCKGAMIDIREDLRLLPVRFDESHDRSSEYYIYSTVAINDLAEVPTGNRACKIILLQCQNCGCKEVVVMDILPVRGQELLKNTDLFSYEDFKEFYES